MSLTRRMFLFSIFLLPYLPKVGRATTYNWHSLAKEDTHQPEIPTELAQYKDQPSLNNEMFTVNPLIWGIDPATEDEELQAKNIIENAPTNCTPIEVALYYLSVGLGELGKEKIPYATAWPVRWNPVIVNFFNATSLKPSGDTTAWCAAFVNYCIMRSKGKTNNLSGTMSAASSSFRKWGKETISPRPGDVVVFKNIKDNNYGHVGFFLSDMGDKILVLGGNQFEGMPIRHTINRKLISKKGSVLMFHSYRTDERLHV